MEEPKKPKRRKKNPLETVAGKKSLARLNRILRALRSYEPIHAAHDLVAAHRKDALRHALHGHLCRWCAENGRPDDVETLFPFTGLPADHLPPLLEKCLEQALSRGTAAAPSAQIDKDIKRALCAADAVMRRVGRGISPKEIAALELLASRWPESTAKWSDEFHLAKDLSIAKDPHSSHHGHIWAIRSFAERCWGSMSRAREIAHNLMLGQMVEAKLLYLPR